MALPFGEHVTTRHFEKHESDMQKLLGLRSTISSGNKWHDPSDGVDDRHHSESEYLLMVDCKCTESQSFRLDRRVLNRWKMKAAELGKKFALPLRFQREDGEDDYVVVPADDYAALLERWRETEKTEVEMVPFMKRDDEIILDAMIKAATPGQARNMLYDLHERLEKLKVPK